MQAVHIVDFIIANILTVIAVASITSMLTAAKGDLRATALSMYNIVMLRGFGRYIAETAVSQVFLFAVSYVAGAWSCFAALTVWNIVIAATAWKGRKYKDEYFIEGSLVDCRITMHRK